MSIYMGLSFRYRAFLLPIESLLDALEFNIKLNVI